MLRASAEGSWPCTSAAQSESWHFDCRKRYRVLSEARYSRGGFCFGFSRRADRRSVMKGLGRLLKVNELVGAYRDLENPPQRDQPLTEQKIAVYSQWARLDPRLA